MFDDDFEKEKRKLVFKEVARVMREHPKNYMEKLAELGFRWVDRILWVVKERIGMVWENVKRLASPVPIPCRPDWFYMAA